MELSRELKDKLLSRIWKDGVWGDFSNPNIDRPLLPHHLFNEVEILFSEYMSSLAKLGHQKHPRGREYYAELGRRGHQGKTGRPKKLPCKDISDSGTSLS